MILETGGDLQDFIFMRPLHLRIRLDCLDHPKATTQKEIISTDTTLEESLKRIEERGRREVGARAGGFRLAPEGGSRTEVGIVLQYFGARFVGRGESVGRSHDGRRRAHARRRFHGGFVVEGEGVTEDLGMGFRIVVGVNSGWDFVDRGLGLDFVDRGLGLEGEGLKGGEG
ncbi:uncharacterized protein A4U43_C02F7630 [Asparagus officinalis]|uniref:Uncharacterized protein n=1 Tax=Asparagus officinalis TaxID=4686 RepID=A0A5P1FLS0_ASPOF|nr:uncharacterized protein A4U43_C02F7630 [Asparagus officinalis]